MKNTEELLEEQASYIGRKSHLDWLCSEFKDLDGYTKLLNMAIYLKSGGNLHQLINRYKFGRHQRYRDSIKHTLIIHLDRIRDDEDDRFTGSLYEKYFSESQLITVLSAELIQRLQPDYDNIQYNNSHSRHQYPHKPEYRLEIGGYSFKKYYKEELSKEENCKRLLLGDLYNTVDIDREDRQTLIYENPWLEIPDYLSHHQLYGYYYDGNLDILPEPFTGNVLDAKIVILTLNQKYKEQQNALNYETLDGDEQRKFLLEQCDLMSLLGTKFVHPNADRIGDSYWNERTEFLRNNYPEAKGLALIYQVGADFSEQFSEIQNQLCGYGWDTKPFTVRLIKYLMQQQRVIILADHKKFWFEAVEGLENYAKLIVLDNPRNPYVTPNNCKNSGKWELTGKSGYEKSNEEPICHFRGYLNRVGDKKIPSPLIPFKGDFPLLKDASHKIWLEKNVGVETFEEAPASLQKVFLNARKIWRIHSDFVEFLSDEETSEYEFLELYDNEQNSLLFKFLRKRKMDIDDLTV